MRRQELPRHHAGAQARPSLKHAGALSTTMSKPAIEAGFSAALDESLADLHAAAEAIWVDTQADCPGLSIDVVPELASTNATLMQQARQGLCTPTLLTTAHQTAGRGRLGRQWVAQPGDCLTFSLGMPLRLDQIPGGGSALALAVGLSLAQSIDTAFTRQGLASPGTRLKWPNDLWWHERKLGGILIEATQAVGQPLDQRWVVIGVGLNLRPAPGQIQAACLQEHWPDTAPRLLPGQVWRWVAPELIRAVQRFEQTGFAPLADAFRQRDALLGREVLLWQRASMPGDQAPSGRGTAQGVNEQGGLLVHTDGQVQTWTSGDVTVRLQTP